ncbi:GAF domain-containing protein [Myxococcota bacterium]|nr:GAF domain-containing protein [Myxococcota bacterium]
MLTDVGGQPGREPHRAHRPVTLTDLVDASSLRALVGLLHHGSGMSIVIADPTGRVLAEAGTHGELGRAEGGAARGTISVEGHDLARVHVEGGGAGRAKDVAEQLGALLTGVARTSLSRERRLLALELRLAARDGPDRQASYEQIREARLALLEYATDHTTDELLVKTLDEVGAITGSPIGFFHSLLADQKTISLQAWSTRTIQEFCQAEGKGRHYDLAAAGVWADCVRLRRPVMHNDYAAVPDKRGLPEGHAHVERELVVPIFRGQKIVAILGVGNKATDYTETDISTVSTLADLAWDITERKRNEELVVAQVQFLETLFDTIPSPVFHADAKGTFRVANRAFAELVGKSADQIVGKTVAQVMPAEVADVIARRNRELFAHPGKQTFELELTAASGERHAVIFDQATLRASDGAVVGIIGVLSDVTDRKAAEAHRVQLEQKLLQSQKLEAVGRLAGGVAHDFNNMLGVILGYAELLLEQLDPAEPMHADISEIRRAAERSAELTRQLLAFARKQPMSPRVIDLNTQIAQSMKMVRRLLREDVELSFTAGANLWPVRLDPAQLDQVLANLSVNARDAIEHEGKISIETKNVTVDAATAARTQDARPGDFVVLEVRDTGVGIAPEAIDRLFEPFYTTKVDRPGSGLGLPMVYGILRQNDGWISVTSALGAGSTFQLYLPRADSRADVAQAARAQAGKETVLVVEDEPQILEITRTILARRGYTVLAAGSPSKALDLCRTHAGTIDLLLTDVVMPAMNGRELALEIERLCPGIAIIFMSGYTAEVIAHRGVVSEGLRFVQKPFSPEELTRKVREALDARRQARA